MTKKSGDTQNNGVFMSINNTISYRQKDDPTNQYPNRLGNVRWVKSKSSVVASNNKLTVLIDPDGIVKIYKSVPKGADINTLDPLIVIDGDGV